MCVCVCLFETSVYGGPIGPDYFEIEPGQTAEKLLESLFSPFTIFETKLLTTFSIGKFFVVRSNIEKNKKKKVNEGKQQKQQLIHQNPDTPSWNS